ncbi:MAG TPA: iron-containing alcohol dehydrogenase [Clostridia bacterium]|nr:iron-containing alcohol dehydrogenase [Clostridia bacterium]
MKRFTLPRDVYYGRGSMKVLRTLDGAKAVIVTGGRSMKETGVLDLAETYLRDAGMHVLIFDGVEPDPSVETVMRGAEQMRRFRPDWIVALGGGSPLDAAKAMWAFYEHPEATFEQLLVPFSFPKLRERARFAAIPSTSGSASEVTAFSVITDYSAGVKYPLADYEITPDIAIVDPDIALTMPPTLAAHTGMDALTHAVEAYVSLLAGPFTDPLALKAIYMVFAYLGASVKGDEAAREQMHYASAIAGMAFSNALLGICHSLAHKTGAAFATGHIPHGCANAIFLPVVIRYNAKNPGAKTRYADIARGLGLTMGAKEGEDDLVGALCDKIAALRAALGIPGTLHAFGIEREEFEHKLKEIALLAVKDACTGSNPQPVAPEAMEAILREAYGDEG